MMDDNLYNNIQLRNKIGLRNKFVFYKAFVWCDHGEDFFCSPHKRVYSLLKWASSRKLRAAIPKVGDAPGELYFCCSLRVWRTSQIIPFHNYCRSDSHMRMALFYRLACLLLLSYVVSSCYGAGQKNYTYNPAHWMADLKDVLYNQSLLAITIPGTHDSGTHSSNMYAGCLLTTTQEHMNSATHSVR